MLWSPNYIATSASCTGNFSTSAIDWTRKTFGEIDILAGAGTSGIFSLYCSPDRQHWISTGTTAAVNNGSSTTAWVRWPLSAFGNGYLQVQFLGAGSSTGICQIFAPSKGINP